jgi:hypothetical protein
MAEPLVVAKSREFLHLLPQFANRHGLIAGATGTGKTVTLRRLAEGFSRIGVPAFMADVKATSPESACRDSRRGKSRRASRSSSSKTSGSKRARRCSGTFSASPRSMCRT